MTPPAPGETLLNMAELEIAGGRLGSVIPADEDVQHRAALQAVLHAKDADEAREFLQALGLMPRE